MEGRFIVEKWPKIYCSVMPGSFLASCRERLSLLRVAFLEPLVKVSFKSAICTLLSLAVGLSSFCSRSLPASKLAGSASNLACMLLSNVRLSWIELSAIAAGGRRGGFEASTTREEIRNSGKGIMTDGFPGFSFL